MTDAIVEPWEVRLSRIEKANEELTRRCRNWRRRVFAAAAFGGLVGLLGAATVTPATLEAQNFVLRDTTGRMRAAVAVRADGTPGLGFFDEAGRARISVELGATGPSINIIDGAGKPQLAMAVRADGTPGVGLFDQAGRVRLSLDLGQAGSSSALNFYNEAGGLRAAMAVRPDGTPALGFFDDAGLPKVSVEMPIEPVAAPVH